ncbi:MAG: 1-acyl-sn-glycerol-3-phosphate acyltransferase [Ponticaulis sp.]|nr:1-acyl-sn-glycerol-3-phosphate acyltransferase [Ponticaulis sp.]|tara:strand:- start:33502 stop:34248 length:747 start_codon:yes stop_codon:yes gene_type:complete
MMLFRSWLFVLWLYGSMVVMGLVWLPALLLPRRVTILGIRIWAHLARWGMRVICGATTEIRGKDHLTSEPVLVASKHQSTIDTLMPFIYLKDPCIILKKELLWYPFFGWYALKAEMIAIDRAGSTKALKAMNAQAKKAASQGRSILIFPEGTRIEPGVPGNYKPGIALMYKDLGLECLPVALNTGFFWPPKGVPRYPGHMVIEFQPMIETGLQRKAFMKELETRLETASERLVAEGKAARAEAGTPVE